MFKRAALLCKLHVGDGMKNDTKPVWLSPGQIIVPGGYDIETSPGSIIMYRSKYPPAYIFGFDWWEYPEYEELRKSKLFTLVNT